MADGAIEIGSKLVRALPSVEGQRPSNQAKDAAQEGLAEIPLTWAKTFTVGTPVSKHQSLFVSLPAKAKSGVKPSKSQCFTAKVNTTIQGIPLQYGSQVEFYPDGKIKHGYLGKNMTIQGFALRRAPIDFYPDGKLMSAYLADRTWRGIPLDEFRVISFDKDGTLRLRTGAETVFQGYPIAKGSDVAIHPNGNIAAFQLSNSMDIQGLPAAKDTTVAFYPNGRLATITLGAKASIGGISWPQKMSLSFDENGTLLRVWSDINATINGLPIQAESWVIVHPNGQIKSVQLARAVQYRGLTLARARGNIHTKLDKDQRYIETTFYPNGQLENGILASKATIQGIKLAPDLITFYENGQLRSGRHAEGRMIHGLPVASGVFSLFENGEIEHCKLYTDVDVAGLPLKAMTHVYFHAPGVFGEGILGKPTSYRGYDLDPGPVSLNNKGELRGMKLAKAATLEGFPAAPGSVTYYNDVLTSFTLEKETEIQGVTVPPGRVRFWRNGRLMSFPLPKDRTVLGYPLRVGVEFFDEGPVTIRDTILSQDYKINDVQLHAGDHFTIYPRSGNIWQAKIQSPGTILGHHFTAPAIIRFDKKAADKFERVILRGSAQATFQGTAFKGHIDLTFDNKGRLSSGWSFQEQTIQSYPIYSRGTLDSENLDRFTFYPNGRLHKFKLAQPMMIQGISISASNTQLSMVPTWVELYPSGKLKSGFLAEDTTIQGVKYRSGYYIHLKEDGSVTDPCTTL